MRLWPVHQRLHQRQSGCRCEGRTLRHCCLRRQSKSLWMASTSVSIAVSGCKRTRGELLLPPLCPVRGETLMPAGRRVGRRRHHRRSRSPGRHHRMRSPGRSGRHSSQLSSSGRRRSRRCSSKGGRRSRPRNNGGRRRQPRRGLRLPCREEGHRARAHPQHRQG